MSDKIVVMSEGIIQQVGTPEDIYNEPQNAFVADFIGESNIFKGIMTSDMKVRFCGGEFKGMDDVPEGTLVDVVVRPEDVIITKPEDGTVAGEITSVIFKGMHYEVTVESGKYEIVIRTTKCYSAGEKIGMCLEPDGIHVMIAEDHTTSFETIINSDYTLNFNDKLISCDITKIIPKTSMKEGILTDENGETVDEALKNLILVIKENIKVRRFTRYEGVCSAYVHGGGTHGILVNFETTNDIDAKDEFVAYGKDIAMQVAAANPGYVDEASVPAEVVAKEKEIMLAQMAQDPKTANKPEAVKEKMIEGKIKKFFKENCLVDQEFVKDGDLTVAQYTAKVAKDLGGEIKIVKFARFVKGEGLEKRADDFASEVASMVK